MTVPRRLCSLLAAVLVAGGLSACGKHQSTGLVRVAETEGIYLDVNDLKYQVQVSRQFNPFDAQDEPFLAGIPEGQRQLEPNEVWFGVLMRVQNETDEALRPAAEIEITDTQGDVFEPLMLMDSNLFAYRPSEPVPPESIVPLPDTPAFDSASRGVLLLFKLTLDALNNRPLELELEGRGMPQQTGIINLDV
ncbi:MAG: hypothetical protein ACR2LK_06950 [Solirubrobacteraceae bacterium]